MAKQNESPLEHDETCVICMGRDDTCSCPKCPKCTSQGDPACWSKKPSDCRGLTELKGPDYARAIRTIIKLRAEVGELESQAEADAMYQSEQENVAAHRRAELHDELTRAQYRNTDLENQLYDARSEADRLRSEARRY